MTELVVPASLHGERVDRGLALLTGLTRSQAARAISEGRARVGGRVVGSGSRRLSQGEVLAIDLETPAAGGDEPPRPAPARRQPGADGDGEGERGGPVDQPGQGPWPQARVVYADDQVVVVDKPAGLVVHPGAGNLRGTLVEQLLAQFPEMAEAGPDRERPGIVHRIDKGTSGLLMVARTAAAREALAHQLAERSVERRYLAVVHGRVDADEGVIDAPLGRSPRDRLRVAVVEGGRRAVTRYEVLDRSAAPLVVALVQCRLETGRTHQIRAHMAAIGHPVLYDQRYAKGRQLAEVRALLPGLGRPWLHASLLGFHHPADGRPLSFEAALPAELAVTLPVLGLALPPGRGGEGEG